MGFLFKLNVIHKNYASCVVWILLLLHDDVYIVHKNA